MDVNREEAQRQQELILDYMRAERAEYQAAPWEFTALRDARSRGIVPTPLPGSRPYNAAI